MPIGSPVPVSQLSNAVAKDAQHKFSGERISFFMMPRLTFSNTRYYDIGSRRWKRSLSRRAAGISYAVF